MPSYETRMGALIGLHTFLMPFLYQVHSKPTDYTPLSKWNGSHRDTFMYTWLEKYAITNEHRHTSTCARKVTFTVPKTVLHSLSNKLVWLLQLNIFRQGGWEIAGSLFDVADSSRGWLCSDCCTLHVCGSGCWHDSAESHLPLSTMDTESRRLNSNDLRSN